MNPTWRQSIIPVSYSNTLYVTVCKHILGHLEDHEILTDLQHGFRSGRSCETQLITTYHHDIASAYLSERIESNFEFRLVDSHNIKQIIKGIKTSRSNGHDGISSELLKLISNDIADSITLIINQSLKDSCSLHSGDISLKYFE